MEEIVGFLAFAVVFLAVWIPIGIVDMSRKK